MMPRFAGTTLAVLLLGQSLSMAAPVTFFGEDTAPGTSTANSDGARNSFLGGIQSTLTAEDFESFTGGATAPLSLSFQSGLTATLAGSSNLRNTGANGHYAVSGTNYWYLAGANSFTVTFSAPVVAVGFYGTDAGDWGGQMGFDWGNTGTFTSVPHSTGFWGSTSGRQIFYGYIDTQNPVTQIVIRHDSFIDQFGFDDFYAGTLSEVVPEPATLLLVGAGLLGLGAALRQGRRKRTPVSGSYPAR